NCINNCFSSQDWCGYDCQETHFRSFRYANRMILLISRNLHFSSGRIEQTFLECLFGSDRFFSFHIINIEDSFLNGFSNRHYDTGARISINSLFHIYESFFHCVIKGHLDIFRREFLFSFRYILNDTSLSCLFNSNDIIGINILYFRWVLQRITWQKLNSLGRNSVVRCNCFSNGSCVFITRRFDDE
ncbi:hypothetical protein ALC57_00143, partial [Trachymyrmex cornetzi]